MLNSDACRQVADLRLRCRFPRPPGSWWTSSCPLWPSCWTHSSPARNNSDNINTTINPEQVPPSGLQQKIQADAAETDGCNNVPKTPGGSSDTPQSRLVSERRTQAAATRGRSVRGEVPGRKWRRRRRSKGEKRGKEMDGGRGWISLCSCEMSLQSIKHSGWTDERIRPS